eukprot:TRINITY_DN6554_c0_g1_i1.p1 TRINITY_DN6554_c0_g1~~TRINITY_DN6554_c0_g1_i1.p1  ORF type:complete len:551 (-),score=108.35 TRINITY_DN6554_c0_g1_i1:40-1605(-)
MAEPEDLPLFFYPPGKDFNRQADAISVCLSMTSISLHFTHVPVSVVELKEVKIAYKKVGQYLLVLTGLVTDSNKALLHQVNLLWDCFQFYNGSFSRLEKLCGTGRANLQKSISDAATFLVPLIQEFHSTSMKFSPMPYTKVLPTFKDTSSFFVLAWQLTSAINNNPNLKDLLCGTALIYNNRVVCTHLDVASTRWIVSFIQFSGTQEGQSILRPHANNFKIPDPNSTDEENTLNFQEFCCPVFVEQTLVEKLANRRQVNLDGVTKLQFSGDIEDHLLSDSEDEASDYFYESSSEGSSKRTTVSSHEYKEDEIDGTRVRVGLYVITLEGGLSIATLIRLPSYFALEPMPYLIQSLYQYYPLVKHLTDTLHAVCAVEKSSTKRRSTKKTFSASSVPGLMSTVDEAWRRRLMDNDEEGKRRAEEQEKPYNFFVFDEITQMQNVHYGAPNPEVTTSFSSSINWAHDLFSEHPESTKLVLRNHAGSVLCRKYFGKETFFQTTTEKFEDVELVASHYLGSDRSAGFL